MKKSAKKPIHRNSSHVAVIVLTYNGIANLKVCFETLSKQTYPNFTMYLIDQASTDGSAGYVEEHFPFVTCIKNKVNTGYAGGNNEGMKQAFHDGADFSLLINDDTYSEPTMVEELVSSYELDHRTHKTGLVQPTILIYDHRELINSVGNAIHYLGFGYCKDFKKKYVPLREDVRILSASGAAILVSKEYVEEVGYFDDDFFMYNEDENYSWRGMLQGYSHLVSAGAVMYHKYDFRRHSNKIYHSEKNRLMIVWENYSALTLFLLFPIMMLNELIALSFALISGYAGRKIASYWYVLSHFGHILRKRKHVQGKRTMPDKPIIEQFESELLFEEMKNPLLLHVVNPIYRFYHRMVVALLRG